MKKIPITGGAGFIGYFLSQKLLALGLEVVGSLPPVSIDGKRRVAVTGSRTAKDWAHQIKQLVDVDYPDAKKITLVMDNLNTHVGASLYKTFKPQEARRILDKLEFHYTPKHGSWLNMAEIEFSILARECLDRRIPDKTILEKEKLLDDSKKKMLVLS
jgi:transposase